MDFLAGIAEVLFEVLPEKVAATICMIATGVAGIAGWLWFDHERAVVSACNSESGRFAQAFNGNAMADCGLSSLLRWVALALSGFGWLFFLVFAAVLVYLIAHPGKKLFD